METPIPWRPIEDAPEDQLLLLWEDVAPFLGRRASDTIGWVEVEDGIDGQVVRPTFWAEAPHAKGRDLKKLPGPPDSLRLRRDR